MLAHGNLPRCKEDIKFATHTWLCFHPEAPGSFRGGYIQSPTQKILNQTRQSRQFIKIGVTSDFFPNDFLTKKSPQVLKYISKNSQAPVLFPHLHAHFTTHFPRNSTQLSSQLNQPFSARHNK